MAFWRAACDGFLRFFASSQAIRFHVFSAVQAVVKQFAIIKVVEAEWAQYFWHVRFLSILLGAASDCHALAWQKRRCGFRHEFGFLNIASIALHIAY
jgi:hypothetical protein